MKLTFLMFLAGEAYLGQNGHGEHDGGRGPLPPAPARRHLQGQEGRAGEQHGCKRRLEEAWGV